MYEIYRYRTPHKYNIRRTSDLYTVGCCSTLQRCLKAEFIPCNKYTVSEFEETYNCKYLFTVNHLDEIEQLYPELFI